MAAEAEAEAEAGKVEEEMQKVKPMKIKEIKAELDVRMVGVDVACEGWIGAPARITRSPFRSCLNRSIDQNHQRTQQERGVGYQDLLEKTEFMRRLAEARVKGITKPPPEAEAAAAAEPEAAAAATGSSSGPSASSAASGAGAGPGPAAAEPKPKEEKKDKVMDEAARYEKALEEIMKMRVSEIKKELDLLKVSHAGLMEKREFAEVLAKARMEPGACPWMQMQMRIMAVAARWGRLVEKS